ncbi:MAG: low affinity iron permease family protein [Gemmatimonadota bacterium]
MNHFFRQFAQRTSQLMGSPWSFMAALLIILAWAVTGPMFHFSDTWQLVINTGTTIITFLMVFLIQNTQNRDAQAMHLKLDELLRAVNSARTGLVELQDLPDEAIEELRAEFHALAESERSLGRDGTEKCEKVADSQARSA